MNYELFFLSELRFFIRFSKLISVFLRVLSVSVLKKIIICQSQIIHNLYFNFSSFYEYRKNPRTETAKHRESYGLAR